MRNYPTEISSADQLSNGNLIGNVYGYIRVDKIPRQPDMIQH